MVLTNHFEEFGGSEIVALETAKWFLGEGDEVILGANRIGAPIHAALPSEIEPTEMPQRLPLEELDLVWCQHNVLAQWPLRAFKRAARRGRLPHVACVSLSPYEPYEAVDLPLAEALTADVYVNSPETGLAQLAASPARIDPANVHVFHNAAPREFWSADTPDRARRPRRPRSLLLVSNHPPAELLAALRRLERLGIATRTIGRGGDFRLLRPSDLRAADGVVTIGKTVPYAIASGTPVYMYDRFGGDGWLTRRNFGTNLEHNFSGRPTRRRLTEAEIADELLSGFSHAADEVHLLRGPANRRRLSLDHQLAELRRKAVANRETERGANLLQHLARSDTRARLVQSLKRRQALLRTFLTQPRPRVPPSPGEFATTLL